MTQHELDADQLLGALGELQRAERAELLRLEEPARQLAAQAPDRAHAFQARLMRELCGVAAPQPPRVRRIRRALSYAAASCALAAAALLWVRAPGPARSAFAVSYTLVPPGPDGATRTTAAQPLAAADPGVVPPVPDAATPTAVAQPPAAAEGRYSLGRTLTFTLRPNVRYSAPLRVLVYGAHERGVLTRLAPTVEQDPAGGALVVFATGAHQQLADEGRWDLRFYVSPEDVAAVSDSELQDGSCPEATRCLAFAARLLGPDNL